jgi:hypothetical protein
MKKIFALLSACLLIGACAPSTPQSRIAAHPEKYSRLSAKHKALVDVGKIDRGMPKDAVLLAWGAPESRYEGHENRRTIERWDYAGSRPVFVHSFQGGYGIYDYWGGDGYYRPYGYRYAVGPELVYMPYTRASVTFSGNKVESWERMK